MLPLLHDCLSISARGTQATANRAMAGNMRIPERERGFASMFFGYGFLTAMSSVRIGTSER
jgi:hypothetical protein